MTSNLNVLIFWAVNTLFIEGEY